MKECEIGPVKVSGSEGSVILVSKLLGLKVLSPRNQSRARKGREENNTLTSLCVLRNQVGLLKKAEAQRYSS